MPALASDAREPKPHRTLLHQRPQASTLPSLRTPFPPPACVANLRPALAAAAAATALVAASRPADIRLLHFLDPGAFETCAVADMNRDSRLGIMSGENGYAGPNWTQHRFRSIEYFRNAIEDLSDLIGVNNDSRPDLLTRDGRPDFVTGKRHTAHNGSEPCEREPLGIYWYEFRSATSGAIESIKHIVDCGCGAGMQIAVADFDDDGNRDLAMGGKTGLFLFENLTRTTRP